MIVIIGGGVTGLAAGMATGGLVLEAAADPGGLCCSYYMTSDRTARTARAPFGGRAARPPFGGDAYRFERGGGHWIFGGDPGVLATLESLAPMARYERRASIYFDVRDQLVPYPLQLNVEHLGADVARRYAAETTDPKAEVTATEAEAGGDTATMRDWLLARFGPTLCEAFFFPFHDRYTAGLCARIAPQDPHKSPVARGDDAGRGYNATFAYPAAGLDELTRQMAARADVRFGARVVAIDSRAKEVALADGTSVGYDVLVSTLPLHETAALASVSVDAEPDPHTSVMVWNIGARRGPKCPDDHWVYLPASASGAHRVGFYSNVDAGFLPASARGRDDRVALYVERAYPGDAPPTADELARTGAAVTGELQALGWIGEVDVVDPTWIDVAYTWSWPGSTWVGETRAALEANGVHTVGRYATWTFQGIADSVRDGLALGAGLTTR